MGRSLPQAANTAKKICPVNQKAPLRSHGCGSQFSLNGTWATFHEPVPRPDGQRFIDVPVPLITAFAPADRMCIPGELLQALKLSLETQEGSRRKQEGKHDLSEHRFVDPPEQLQPKPGARDKARQTDQEEPYRFCRDRSFYAEPYCRHQEDRDSYRLENRALNIFGPAAQTAPDCHENPREAGETAERAIEEAHRGVDRGAIGRGQFQGRPKERIDAVQDKEDSDRDLDTAGIGPGQ